MTEHWCGDGDNGKEDSTLISPSFPPSLPPSLPPSGPAMLPFFGRRSSCGGVERTQTR